MQLIQNDLFGGPAVRIDVEPRTIARRSDPATSHAAAARVDEFSGRHTDIIVAALRRHGPMTVDQIAAKRGLQSQQINKRTPKAAERGLIRLTGETRLSASGREERVWRVVG